MIAPNLRAQAAIRIIDSRHRTVGLRLRGSVALGLLTAPEEKSGYSNRLSHGNDWLSRGRGSRADRRRKEGRDKNDWETRWSKANKFILGLTEEMAVEIMQNH